nr:helix-turn-helix transcriptional regulator [Selenomonas infelix]
MTLGDVIKAYRKSHKLSMDEFAKRSALSKGYISMLEKNKNPKTGKVIIPSIQTFQSLAKAMSTSVEALMRSVDKGQLVSLDYGSSDNLPMQTPVTSPPSTNVCTQKEADHLKKYRALDEDGRELVDGLLDTLHEQRSAKSDESWSETTGG